MTFRITFKKLFIYGFLLYTITAFWNVGIMALDDYAEIISRVVPAQDHSFSELARSSGIRSPIPSLYVHFISQAALKMGITNPIWQLRFCLWVLGIFSMGVLFWGSRAHFSISAIQTRFDQKCAVSLVLFYFASPLLFTRPMIESLSVPYLFISSVFLCRYWHRGDVVSMLFATLFLTCSCLFRFQVGVCFLAIPLIILIKKQYVDLFVFIILAAFLFIFTGAIDWLLRGNFHASLIEYVNYNLSHSSEYGVTPFYTPILLFLGLSIPPAFFSKYQAMSWRSAYKPLVPVLFYFGSFLVVHCLIPHKEERFMIPILPLFLLLLIPMGVHLIHASGSLWRSAYFFSVNAILLISCTINIPQSSVIDLVKYTSSHPDLTHLISYKDSVVLYPSAYSVRSVELIKREEIDLKNLTCSEAVVVRLDFEPLFDSYRGQFEKVASFSPGILEALIVKANPKRNARRGELNLYLRKGC